jgi:hypothetical protein
LHFLFLHGRAAACLFADLGSSSQKFAKHDLNMQLDPGFHAVFGCWLHVCSEAEFWISVDEKSSLS